MINNIILTAGPKSTLVVQLSENQLVDHKSLRIGLTNEDGQVVQDDIILSNPGGAAGILQASINTPSGKFKVLLSGITQGHKFQRLSRTGFEASDMVMVPMKGGEDYTAAVSKASSKIEMYVYNGGDPDTFALSISTSHGSVATSSNRLTLDKGQNRTMSIDLRPPSRSASLVGKLATVTVIATGQRSSKKFQSEVKMLLVP